MSRPPVEVADILRVQGDCFREQNRSWLGYQQLSVLRAIVAKPLGSTCWQKRRRKRTWCSYRNARELKLWGADDDVGYVSKPPVG
jgi:hypothetical protein